MWRSALSALRIQALVAISLAALALGCRPKPPCDPADAKGCVVTKMAIVEEGTGATGGVGENAVKDHLATAESSFFVTNATVELFGQKGELFFRYEHFDRLVLERDLERVERYYRSRGFYEARVRAGRVIRTGDATVRVAIEVDVGPPTLVTRVDLEPLDPTKPLPKAPRDLVSSMAEAKDDIEVGARFEEETYENTKRRLTRVLTDRGFAYAKVTGRANVDLAKHSAHVIFSVDTGPPCTFGKVTIEGLGDIPDGPLRAAIRVREGRPFSTEALDASQTTLSEFGVFGSISAEIERSPEGVDPPNPVVPVRFVVQPAAMRSIQLGGGAELGGRVQAHLVSKWEHKNFLGGLRRFTIEGRGGVRFFPWQLTEWTGEVRPLPDVRTTAELSQPGFLEPRTTGTFRFEANFYRPDTADSNPDPLQNLYANFEMHAIAGLERPFWRSRVRIGGSLNAQLIMPVAVYGEQPSGFEPLFLPYVEGRVALDLRFNKQGKRDALNPHTGVYAGTAVQVAGVFPEVASDIRIQPEVRAYAPLGDDVTLGFRLAAGVLLPFGYGQRLFDPALRCADGDAQCQSERARAVQIMQLRGFYSGGASSNRGYGYNGVNPQEKVISLFTNPADAVPVPLGGRWLWEAALELRFPIYGDFGAALFVDTSDVWNDTFAFRPHLSPGFGLRYATPIGPARLDLGFRVPCAQTLQGCVKATDGGPPLDELPVDQGGPPRPLGLPIYIAIAIGEAF